MRKYFHTLYQIREIQLNLRSMYFITCNSFTGHYKCDMNIFLDRLCVLRLVEINAEEKAYIRFARPDWNRSKRHGFTSQRGNRNNFRNESYRSLMVTPGLDDNFCASGLLNKIPGQLEFDYISVSRPSLDVVPIDDFYLNALLMSRQLKPYSLGYVIHVTWSSNCYSKLGLRPRCHRWIRGLQDCCSTMMITLLPRVLRR